MPLTNFRANRQIQIARSRTIKPMKKLWIALAALVIHIPLGIWWFSDEQVVMRRTKHLMEVISMSVGRGGLRHAKVFSMNGMLAPEVEMETPDIPDANGIFNKQEMESAFSWICQYAKSSSFRVTDFRKVEVDRERAKVYATVEGFMELPTYRPADGKFDVRIDWEKGGDGWRFSKLVWKNF